MCVVSHELGPRNKHLITNNGTSTIILSHLDKTICEKRANVAPTGLAHDDLSKNIAMASIPAIPTSREVLTSLIDSITQMRPHPAASDTVRTAQGRPFSQLPPSTRPLLTTLHVLFPTLLLPALDLLDRSLVTKVVDEATTATTTTTLPCPASQESATDDIGESSKDSAGITQASFYLVRSAASTSRRTFNAFANSTPYIVRFAAWSCSCANFAFDAYPAATGDGGPDILQAGVRGLDSVGYQEDKRAWEFGGLAFDGREPRGGGVPCCKHLLACLLAERWHGVLGRYVVEKRASKEEMAGLISNT